MLNVIKYLVKFLFTSGALLTTYLGRKEVKERSYLLLSSDLSSLLTLTFLHLLLNGGVAALIPLDRGALYFIASVRVLHDQG